MGYTHTMSDEMSIGGRRYISSKRAAEISDYTQDYIGQLARKRLIDAQRVGGLWYVSMDSLAQYKEKAESYVPVPPQNALMRDRDSLVSFDGKDYVSAGRAAEITGYHPDYVGQLARGGTVLSRQVGNRWYVERSHLLDHKKEKDGLLAAVQSEAVGIVRAEAPRPHEDIGHDDTGPYFKYTRDDRDLLPVVSQARSGRPEEVFDTPEEGSHSLPIRIVRSHGETVMVPHTVRLKEKTSEQRPVRQSRIANKYIAISGVLATIVIVLSVGVIMPKSGWVYTQGGTEGSKGDAMLAGVAAAVTKVGDLLEEILAPELTYRRPKATEATTGGIWQSIWPDNEGTASTTEVTGGGN